MTPLEVLRIYGNRIARYPIAPGRVAATRRLNQELNSSARHPRQPGLREQCCMSARRLSNVQQLFVRKRSTIVRFVERLKDA